MKTRLCHPGGDANPGANPEDPKPPKPMKGMKGMKAMKGKKDEETDLAVSKAKQMVQCLGSFLCPVLPSFLIPKSKKYFNRHSCIAGFSRPRRTRCRNATTRSTSCRGLPPLSNPWRRRGARPRANESFWRTALLQALLWQKRHAIATIKEQAF